MVSSSSSPKSMISNSSIQIFKKKMTFDVANPCKFGNIDSCATLKDSIITFTATLFSSSLPPRKDFPMGNGVPTGAGGEVPQGVAVWLGWVGVRGLVSQKISTQPNPYKYTGWWVHGSWVQGLETRTQPNLYNSFIYMSSRVQGFTSTRREPDPKFSDLEPEPVRPDPKFLDLEPDPVRPVPVPEPPVPTSSRCAKIDITACYKLKHHHIVITILTTLKLFSKCYQKHGGDKKVKHRILFSYIYNKDNTAKAFHLCAALQIQKPKHFTFVLHYKYKNQSI
ncbi:hypothetical protein LXL04_017831 [Taraxacum kok-saghyz]